MYIGYNVKNTYVLNKEKIYVLKSEMKWDIPE